MTSGLTAGNRTSLETLLKSQDVAVGVGEPVVVRETVVDDEIIVVGDVVELGSFVDFVSLDFDLVDVVSLEVEVEVDITDDVVLELVVDVILVDFVLLDFVLRDISLEVKLKVEVELISTEVDEDVVTVTAEQVTA